MTDTTDTDDVEEETAESGESGDESASMWDRSKHPSIDLHARERLDAAGTTAYAIGGTIGAFFGWVVEGLAVAFTGFLREFTTFVPFGPRLWRGIMLSAAYQYQKSSGADALALSHYQKSVLPEPVSYELPEKAGDRPGWKVHGSERHYDGATGGKEVMRLGRASVVLVDVDDPFSVTPFQARFSEALELDKVRPLIAPGAELKQVIVEVFDERTADGDPVADGGEHVRRAESEVTLDPFSVEAFEGDIVDLSSQEGSDGMYVMAKKVMDTYQETSSVEEMRRQEERGLAAVLDKSELRAFMWKVFLVGSAVAALGLVGKELVYALFGAETVNSTIPGVVSILPSLGVI